MSSTPLQCLFCNHLNPGGASYCNECGSPLNLQPCARCGAIDKRDAKACYKCGEVFSPLASLDLAPPDASNEIQAENEIRSESERAGSHPAIAPTIIDDQPALAETNDADITSERTSLPQYAALMLNEFGQGFLPESKEKQVNAVGTVDPETRFRNDDPVHISDGLQLPDETISKRKAATSTGSRLLWVVASLALLVAMAGSVYYYHGQSMLLAENQNMNQLAPPPARTATIASPLPASEAEIKPLQEPPIIKQCPEAITALGLCSLDTKQE